MPRTGTLLAVVMTAIALAAAGASAQTLTSPGPRSARSASDKAQLQDHLKPCPAYGPGFVQLPGTNACIKIGGGVTTDVGGTGN